MLYRALSFLLLVAMSAAGADAPLPGLKVEAVDGGSILRVRNTGTQPLVAYLIELVGYPGSAYSLWRDDPATPIQPGDELTIKIVNMTVGAAPEYVKMQAAVYADGATAGIPEKATQIVERRRYLLETTRELIQRLDRATAANTAKSSLVADLKQWSDALPPAGKPRRNTQPAINQVAARELIAATCARIDAGAVADALAWLRASESKLAQAKPSL